MPEEGICALDDGLWALGDAYGVGALGDGVCALGDEEGVWALPTPIPAIPRASTEAVASTNFFVADLH